MSQGHNISVEPPPEECTGYQSRFVTTREVRLHTLVTGPKDGPLVLLLHGFPEFWYGWRKQIPALAEAGYHVWVPDQRGYNLSEKPPAIASYTVDRLSRDVGDLIEASGKGPACVVGHDWGALIGWWLAAHYPDLLHKLVVINVPHGRVMRHHLQHNPRQLARSWYALFFQLPWLPETMLSMNHSYLLRRALVSTSLPGTFTEVDLVRYQAAWSRPGALQAMINWYRAAARPRWDADDQDELITVPTLLIWGVQDRFLGQEMAGASLELCSNGYLAMFDTATHWVHHEKHEDVNALIRQFLEA